MFPMGIAENLKTLRKAKRLSQIQLAKLSGVSQQLISQIENGDNVSTTRLPDLARALSARVSEIDPSYSDSAVNNEMVKLVGYVGAGAEAHFYSSADGGLEEVPAPDGSTPSTVAVEVRGESLGALFEHWLVYYDEVRSPVTPDMHGKLCVVGLHDDRVLVKQVKPSKASGLFHLLSNTEGPILDVEIAWAAKVKSMVPR